MTTAQSPDRPQAAAPRRGKPPAERLDELIRRAVDVRCHPGLTAAQEGELLHETDASIMIGLLRGLQNFARPQLQGPTRKQVADLIEQTLTSALDRESLKAARLAAAPQTQTPDEEAPASGAQS